MSVHTSNAYGRITVTEDSIAQVAADVALDCYGVVDLVSKTFSDNLSDLFRRKRLSRGVNVYTNGDRIFIDLYVIFKYGLSIDAVAQSLKKAVKYRVERFSGMPVDTINVHVVGIKV